ncbi:MAG: hypothetical protein KDE27_13545, partial [Planctomycetes bacterium]|nr:hypothetical protein [Planctomycetota bacterium]
MKILATAVLLTPLACAQTFVVDAANGPGTNFTDIATAVAAVPDGAILEVRPGEYGVFQIQNKSLTIVGTAGVLVRSGIEGTAFDVVGLASDQAVTVRQVAWDGVFPGLFSSVVCRNNRGTVLIDECSPTSGGGRVIFTDCDRAFVRDCLLRSNSVTTAPLDCYSSNVVVTGTDIRSQAFCLRQGGGRVQIAASALTTMVPIAFGQAAVFVG